MDKVLLFIQARGKIEYLRKARDFGYKIAVAQKDFNNHEKVADFVIDVDPCNFDELIVKVSEFAQKVEIHGVLTLHEHAVEETALIAKALGLPGLNVEGAIICRNKYLTRLALERNGINNPKFKLVTDIEEVDNVATEIGYPIIIKPLKFSGSTAVIRVNSDTELINAKQKLINIRQNTSCRDTMLDKLTNYWLVEEYLDGFEISVQAVTYNGETIVISIHDKLDSLGGPDFAEKYIVAPSPRINSELETRIIKATIDVLHAVKFDFGVSHLEFRIVNGEPILLEANARIGGGATHDITYYSTGVNLLKCLTDLTVGGYSSVTLKSPKYVAVNRILVSLEGTIGKVSGLEKAKNVQGVVLVKQYLYEGDLVRTVTRDVGGAVLTVAESSDIALATAKYAASMIQFELKEN